MNKRTLELSQLNDYKAHLICEEKSKLTVDKYIHDISRLYDYMKDDVITKISIVQYKNKLISEGYATRSINSILASINGFFRFLGWNDCCVKSLKLQNDIFRSEEKELTKADYYKLVKSANKCGNKRIALILQTICGTGIRVSELKYITVEAAKSGRARVCCKAKLRDVFIVKELSKKLLQYAKTKGILSGAIFISKNGNPIDRTSVWREMKKLCDIAELNPTKVYPHNLRHLFARIFYSVEKDIVKLADILGHSSINTTRIYMISTGAEHSKRLEMMKLII